MQMHKLDNPFASPESLSHAVVDAGEMLGIERAEVASIINFMCEGTGALFEDRVVLGALFEDRVVLEPNTETWRRAELFVRLFEALYDAMDGNGVQMVHWLRSENPALDGEPLVIMEDQGRLADVLEVLEAMVDVKTRH
jgi:hypothetical protein